MKKEGAFGGFYGDDNDTVMPPKKNEALEQGLERKEVQVPFGGMSNGIGFNIFEKEKDMPFVQREKAEKWKPEPINQQEPSGERTLEELEQEKIRQREEALKESDILSQEDTGNTDSTPLYNIEKINKLASHMNEVKENTSDMTNKIDNLLEEMQAVKEGMNALSCYEKTVEILKKSLAGNQRNEENMAKELAIYKKDMYFTNIRPFLEFMVQLYSEMSISEKNYLKDREGLVEKYGEEMFNEIIELHNYFLKQIENQLYIQGVEIITYQPDTDFITGEQVLSKPVLTDDEEKIGKVAEAVSNCYKYQDKILRKAMVQVYKRNPKIKDI